MSEDVKVSSLPVPRLDLSKVDCPPVSKNCGTESSANPPPEDSLPHHYLYHRRRLPQSQRDKPWGEYPKDSCVPCVDNVSTKITDGSNRISLRLVPFNHLQTARERSAFETNANPMLSASALNYLLPVPKVENEDRAVSRMCQVLAVQLRDELKHTRKVQPTPRILGTAHFSSELEQSLAQTARQSVEQLLQRTNSGRQIGAMSGVGAVSSRNSDMLYSPRVPSSSVCSVAALKQYARSNSLERYLREAQKPKGENCLFLPPLSSSSGSDVLPTKKKLNTDDPSTYFAVLPTGGGHNKNEEPPVVVATSERKASRSSSLLVLTAHQDHRDGGASVPAVAGATAAASTMLVPQLPPSVAPVQQLPLLQQAHSLMGTPRVTMELFVPQWQWMLQHPEHYTEPVQQGAHPLGPPTPTPPWVEDLAEKLGMSLNNTASGTNPNINNKDTMSGASHPPTNIAGRPFKPNTNQHTAPTRGRNYYLGKENLDAQEAGKNSESINQHGAPPSPHYYEPSTSVAEDVQAMFPQLVRHYTRRIPKPPTFQRPKFGVHRSLVAKITPYGV